MRLIASGLIAIAATKTALIIGSTANIRPRILKAVTATDGVPSSDQSLGWAFRRATALGTTTAVTFQGPDLADLGGTLVVTAGSNATVEPTYSTGNMYLIYQNPRATKEWTPYDQKGELIMPATAAAGIGLQVQAAGGGVGNFQATVDVEQ
jgi:hypothetical protein